MDALQDLHDVMDAEIYMATADIAKKDEEDSRQTNKVGNTIFELAQSPPRLSMDVPSIGAPSVHSLGGL